MNVTAAEAVAGRSRGATIGTAAFPALFLPWVFIVGLAVVGLLPSIHTRPRLLWSILGAAASLAAATLGLAVWARRRTLVVDVQLRAQHYLQACAQGSVLLYWGWYWRPVYEAAPLHRRAAALRLRIRHAAGVVASRPTTRWASRPFPVIFSINLFLWFKPDWFYLQFLMIALGFAAKELIRWEQGRAAHAHLQPVVVSARRVLAGADPHRHQRQSRGARRSPITQFYPPQHLPVPVPDRPAGSVPLRRDDDDDVGGRDDVPVRAGCTSRRPASTSSIDSYIPIAVFLGMHLLFTDPSTSPRTELGRIIFGVMYGLEHRRCCTRCSARPACRPSTTSCCRCRS